MQRHLNLVESDFEHFEKRVLPKFPFSYLIFKTTGQTFEVQDISFSGMQLAIKSGDLSGKENDILNGVVYWNGKELDIQSKIKWKKGKRLGVEFSHKTTQRNNVNDFLSVEAFSSALKPLHSEKLNLDLPSKLKYWLHSDGPAQIFIWQHNDGELSKFQIILMENFIEWTDGEGLMTGRVISKRGIETPLIDEDEFVFKIDSSLDKEKKITFKNFISKIDSSKLSQETLNFLSMKLG